MSCDRRPLAGYVLAGGRSTRLGRDKWRLEVAGRSALEHQMALLRAIGVEEPVAVGRADLGPSAAILDDGGHMGPLDGIVTALRHAAERSPDSVAVIVAVDLWNLTTTALRTLVDDVRGTVDAETSGWDVAHLASRNTHGDERDQPLAAAWRVASALPVLAEAFAAGETSVMRAWRSLHRRSLLVPEDVLVNVNTPEELSRWRGSVT